MPTSLPPKRRHVVRNVVIGLLALPVFFVVTLIYLAANPPQMEWRADPAYKFQLGPGGRQTVTLTRTGPEGHIRLEVVSTVAPVVYALNGVECSGSGMESTVECVVRPGANVITIADARSATSSLLAIGAAALLGMKGTADDALRSNIVTITTYSHECVAHCLLYTLAQSAAAANARKEAAAQRAAVQQRAQPSNPLPTATEICPPVRQRLGVHTECITIGPGDFIRTGDVGYNPPVGRLTIDSQTPIDIHIHTLAGSGCDISGTTHFVFECSNQGIMQAVIVLHDPRPAQPGYLRAPIFFSWREDDCSSTCEDIVAGIPAQYRQ